MCRSFETSITTYLATVVSTVIVWNLTTLPIYRFIALIMLVVGHMQLIDALLWTTIRYKWSATNLFVSRYILPTLLATELLASYYGIRYFFGWSNRLYEVILWFGIFCLFYSWLIDCNETIKHTDGYLLWCNDTYRVISQLGFLFLLVFPIIMGYPNILLKWILLGAIIGTFAINFLRSTYGTRWCWSSNIISVILLAVVLYERYIAKKKMN